jgi:hypothetical protein
VDIAWEAVAMREWLMLAAICLPTIAHADPKVGRPDTDGAVRTSYEVSPPAPHGYVPDGWGMRASFKGRAMDLQSRDWTEDPHVQPGDVEAGYGWRDGGAAALIGYEEHDYGPRPQADTRAIERNPNQPPPVNSSGVLGFSFVLHGR